MDEKITTYRPAPHWPGPLDGKVAGYHPPFSTVFVRRMRLGDDELSNFLRDYFTEANLKGLDFNCD